jgi:hypothetical protein
MRNPSLRVVAIGRHSIVANYCVYKTLPPITPVGLSCKLANCTCAIAPPAAQARRTMKYST